MAWKSMEKVWMADIETVYSSFDAYNAINKGDEMLF